MIVENQKIKIKISTKNKIFYNAKGYKVEIQFDLKSINYFI